MTGTPGVGKTTVAAELARRGHAVLDLARFARDAGLATAVDEARGSLIVDERALAKAFAKRHPRSEVPLFVEGHMSHLLPLERIALLRLNPRTLRERLEARAWNPAKVQENVEAEALDVIAGEILDAGTPAVEVDTTGRTVPDVADRILAIARGEPGPEVGSVAWDLEAALGE